MEGVLVGTNGYGYKFVTMDPVSGEVLDKRNFDTWHNTSVATDMANYLLGLPEQRVVLLAVRADGSANMNESAYATIEDLGSSLVRQIAANDSFALVGKKGLSPGQAAERRVLRYSGTTTAGSFRLATPGAVRVEPAGYEEGYTVLESVGSGLIRQLDYRGAWALIRRKGSFPNNVMEMPGRRRTAGARW